MLDERNADADADGLSQDFLIVDFHEVFGLPIVFLRNWVRARGAKRLQLCPPYREHLSQSFARYFMRVGCQSTSDLRYRSGLSHNHGYR